MDNGKKNAPLIFTTNDIRKHARDWTLAGDAGLLAHLEQFSENIINKTQETQRHFSELVSDYEVLHTKVGNVTNQFLALQNCQFVENRVYDEETPTEEKREFKVQDEDKQEKLLLTQYKEAVEVGVKLLDTHFQEIQLPPNSDSDEEDEVSAGNSVIWKAKNLYAGKKFPLLIGSAEWWADDQVGLRANEEILESDKIASESESDLESLKSIEKPMKTSFSSSMENVKSIPTKQGFLGSLEDLFGFDRNENVKGVLDRKISKGSNSLLEETSSFLPFDKEPNIEAKVKDDSFSDDQLPEQTLKTVRQEATTSKSDEVDNDFTRELVAKLVSVTNKPKGKKEEDDIINKANTEDNLFNETDDSSNLFSTQKVTEKLPAKNLFFEAENDDDLFRGENDLFSGGILFESDALKNTDTQPKERKRLESSFESNTKEKKEVFGDKKNAVNDLFDDLDDDGTLFDIKPVNKKAADQSLPPMEGDSFKTAKSSNPGTLWDSDEGLFDGTNTEVDQDFFNSSSLFANSADKVVESQTPADLKSKQKMSDLFAKESHTDRKQEKVNDLARKESSNSDSQITKNSAMEFSFDDLFGFSSPSEQHGNKKINILDSEEDDLFSKTPKEEKKLPIKVITLPEDEVDDDAALFGEKPKPPDSVSVSSSRSSLFDDVSASKSRLASVFEKDKSNKSEDDLFSGADESLFAGNAKPEKDLFSIRGKEKEKSSLFDDCDDGDDLFCTERKDLGEKSPEDPAENIEDVFESDHVVRKQDLVGKSFIENLGDNNLFETSEATTKPRETKSDILRPSNQKVFSDDLEDAEMFSDTTEMTKPKPPSSLSLRGTETESKSKTVGKLNIPENLKNRFESAAKHISQRGVKVPEEEKKEVLDEPVQASTLLKCPSKDRVKIPGRRRPQSRRARQEAIRNSGTWDQTISPNNTSNVTQTAKDSLSSPVMSNPLSPSTDEEDFFKVPELDTNFEKEDQSIFKSDLFESSKTSKLDDSLLFDGAPVLSPTSPKKSEEPQKNVEEPKKVQQADSLFGSVKPKTVSLFADDDNLDDENDDENLFKMPKPRVVEPVLPQTPKTDGKIKKVLFDPFLDDDDEDDLFGGSSRAAPNPPAHEKPKSDGEPMEKGNSSFVDPLGLMKY